MSPDVDPPHVYDPECGCDQCVADDPREALFAGLWAELLRDDPRDVTEMFAPPAA